MTTTYEQYHHYTFDAATLLEQCLVELQEVMRTSKTMGRRTCLTLFDLQTALLASEHLLLEHFQSLLEQERMYGSPTLQELFVNGKITTPSNKSFTAVVGFLRMVVEHRQIENLRRNDRKESKMDDDDNDNDDVDPFHLSPCCYYPNRNASDAMLFRLIVLLQLCLVRLDDARYVLTGRRRRRAVHASNSSKTIISSSSSSRNHFHPTNAMTHHHHHNRTVCHTLVHAAAYMGTLFYGTGFLALTQRQQVQWRILLGGGGGGYSHHHHPTTVAAKSMAWTAGGIGMAALTAGWLRNTWNTWWMSSKIVDSTRAVELWNRNWHSMQAENNLKQRCSSSSSSSSSSISSSSSSSLYRKTETVQAVEENKTAIMMSTCAIKSERIVQYALNSRHETALCNSKGDVRFLVLKRAMDLVYTSMDASPTCSTTTRFFDVGGPEQGSCWRLKLAEAAFFSSTGDRHRAMEVAASSRAARELLHNIWGGGGSNNNMASLPPVKTLSLRACQLLNQGAAAVADRIDICGITCFVLSREPVPEMTSAIKNFHHHRHGRRNSPARILSSIHEEDDDEHHQSAVFHQRHHCNRTPFEKRNVILHLTGGGFFSHCIACDLPNLLHWSEVTGAVVICPEYGLLPEYTFPSALGHIERVYKALLSSNFSKALLGFEVNRLIVTGESAGGHLAVSLCTKLITDSKEDTSRPPLVLPNALLCSSPVLDLSLGTHKRAHGKITGTRGGGLVTAISEAYLPSELGIDKQDPRASPLYATNEVLCKFPPSMLLFAKQRNVDDTENDPTVLFYHRLEIAGVQDCILRAVAPHHLPNNYLGLGMAGFPEESHEQYNHISTWLCSQFGSLLSTREE